MSIRKVLSCLLVVTFILFSFSPKLSAEETGGSPPEADSLNEVSTEIFEITPELDPEDGNLITLAVLSSTGTVIELFWTSGENKLEVAEYEIYRDGELLDTTESFAYTDTGLEPGTAYTYDVKAKDADGNIIAGSNTVSVTADAGGDATEEIPAAEMAETGIDSLIRGTDEDYEKSSRMIVKYKNEKGKEKAGQKLEEKQIKDGESGKQAGKLNRMADSGRESKMKNADLFTFDGGTMFRDVISELEALDMADEIEYIQPDYEVTLASADPYFGSQWGLENIQGEDIAADTGSVSSDITVLEQIRMVVPHIADAIEGDPECLDFFTNTPAEELRMRIEAMDVPGSLPPEMLMELTYDPMLRDMLLDPGIQAVDGQARQQYLCDANVIPAWESSTGDGAVVAVIDTGIDTTHEDLAQNIWVNPYEIPGNGVDDDGNGYVDDVNGWNFCDGNNEVHNPALTGDEGHGTHIAGIIAAAKDNETGIAGAAPGAKIMPLKVFSNGMAYTSDIIEAIEYASSMGVKIANCSWGTSAENPALQGALQEAAGTLFVCAAGNSGANIDESPVYPAAYSMDNIITAASVGRGGQLSGFSNCGEASVDVAAPGEDIISTQPGNAYDVESGTSMAAAFVSGEAALLLGMDGSLNPAGLKGKIMDCSDRLSSLTGKVAGSCKINCGNAVCNVSGGEIIEVSRGAGIPDIFPVSGDPEGFELLSAPTVEGQFVDVACGYRHTLALKSDGTVWACGWNDYGQLGDGTTTDRTTPVQVSDLSGVTAIAGGGYHNLALKGDGTVWAWGYNNYGQLGDGTITRRKTPVQVSGLSGVIDIVGGCYHSLALKGDGTIWAWGYNSNGQLGDGTTRTKATPVQVSGITAIAGGGSYSLALKGDGTVWTWGWNYFGQLGDGTTTTRTTPVQVSGLSGITAIAGGGSYSLALKGDGTVWAWGRNNYGQLGDGTITDRTTPVQVSGLSGVTAIAGGTIHSLAIKGDGTVWAWGYNNYGQLGDGTTICRTTPIQVSGLSGVTAVAGGYYHSLALRGDETVWAWGYNNYGQLGDGTTIYRITPVQVSGLSGVTAIAGGDYHSLALKGDGTVWAWGYNNYGQLGDGTTTRRTTPVQVSGLSGVTAIAGCYCHSLAIKSDGTVWAWGYNNYGQLGDGTTTTRTTPVQVSGVSGVTAIAGGYGHSLALKEDGTVWTWGYNEYGQLGDGTTTTRKTPVQVSGLSGVTAIAGGYYHSLALKGDGIVWTWGYNNCGQLGNGEKGYSEYPEWSFGTPPVVVNIPIYYALKLNNACDTGSYTFTVTYDPDDLEVADLCAATPQEETAAGAVQGTNITITEYTPGTIKFTVDNPVEQGKSWSGVVNCIRFSTTVENAQAGITCTVE